MLARPHEHGRDPDLLAALHCLLGKLKIDNIGLFKSAVLNDLVSPSPPEFVFVNLLFLVEPLGLYRIQLVDILDA